MQTLRFGTLLLSGVLSGFELGVHYGLGAPPSVLNDAGQILLRQAVTLRLRLLAPALFLGTMTFGVALTVQEGRGELLLHCVALGALSIWIFLRAARTVRVNSATLEWDPEEPPEGWRELLLQTERFHLIAAWATVLAFTCFLLSIV